MSDRPTTRRRPPLRHRHHADAGDAARRWPTPRWATTRYGEDPTVRRLRVAGGRRCSARRPRSTCRRARWPTSSRCARSARPAPRCCAASAPTCTATSARRRPVNAGVQLRPLPDADGALAPARRRARARRRGAPPARDLARCSLENTHMPASGRPWRVAEVDAVATVARDARLAVHCDGARIWNAAIALGVGAARARRRRRHRDVLPVEGPRRAGRLAAVRRPRDVDRRRARRTGRASAAGCARPA